MGMFEKDKTFGGKRLDETFKDGESFILWDAAVIAENVKIGDEDMPPATKTGLVVSFLDNPAQAFVVGTFASSIADKVREKEDGDLPAVVCTEVIPSKTKGRNDARVLSFRSAYAGKPPKDCPTPADVTFDPSEKSAKAEEPAPF